VHLQKSLRKTPVCVQYFTGLVSEKQQGAADFDEEKLKRGSLTAFK